MPRPHSWQGAELPAGGREWSDPLSPRALAVPGGGELVATSSPLVVGAPRWGREAGITLLVLSGWLLGVLLLAERPWELLATHAIIVPLAVIGAALANATAVGGGFVFVPLFAWVYGLAPLLCLKLALATQAFGMTSGALGWSRSSIHGRAFALGCAGSAIGMVVGTFAWVPTGTGVQIFFGLTSLLVAAALVIEDRIAHRPRGRLVPSLGIGFVLVCAAGGLVNAWVSIGIGEVVALWLLFRQRERLSVAIGTGVSVLAFSSILGFAFHGYLGGIPFEYLLFTAPGVLIGGRLGALIAHETERRRSLAPTDPSGHPLKRTVAGVVLVDGIIMIAKSL